MRHRPLGKTGYDVSEIGFGAWAIGGSWGDVDDDAGMAALHAALDNGVTFFDTADAYGNGHSEQLLARLRRERPDDPFVVATKAGRRMMPNFTVDGFTAENLNAWIDRSREYLEQDTLDLVQLHSPPTELYYRPEVFAAMDEIVAAGKVRHFGVSVEKPEEALKAIEYPGVKTVQIIFNMFRLRPSGLFFREALARDIGVIVRVPMASGLLTGKMTRDTTFHEKDHRNYNIKGAVFDVGETFSGVDFATGIDAVEELRPLAPAGATMAQFALRWILMFDAVSTIIPGARTPEQAAQNAAAAALPPLSPETMAAVEGVYDRLIREQVHHRW